MGSIDIPDFLKEKMKKNIEAGKKASEVIEVPDFLKKKDEAGNVLNGSSASALEIPSTSLNDQFLNWNGRNKKGQLLANFKNDPNWKPAPEQVKPVGSKPAEKSIFDLPDNVIFTPNLLDSQELQEYNQKAASTPIPQLPNKTQIVKDIIASRQNDAVMRERAKKFLVNDAAKMDLKVDAENFPKVEEYFNDKKNIVQNEIQGLLGDLEDLGVAWGENLYLNPDAQKKMKRISELDGYLGELKKYSNIFIREQAVRDIKPTDYDNYSDYLKAIGRKVNSVNNYEGIKKKEEAILNKTDDTRSKQITDNENYNFELAGIEALQDNIIANFKAGNIDEEAARSEMAKLYISNQTLENRYPEAALDNLRKYLGDYIAQKRKDNDGNLKQTWHNVIYAAPSSKEIITAIHDLRANDQVEISDEQEKLLAADPDKIPLTSMLGHIYKNTILKGAQTLNSMVGIDNEERKLEFRDPTMYLPVQPGEIPMPVAVGEKNIVRMQPNPAAGQHADVLSWATANIFSDVAGTIASYVRLNKVFGVVANKLLGGLAGAETTGMAVTAAGELKPITALTAAQTNLARNILSSTYLNYYDKLEASKDLTDNTTAQKAYALSSSIITGLVFAEINPGKILSGITGAEEKAMGQKFIDKLMQGKGNIEPEKMKSFFAELAMNTAKNLGHNMSLVKANQIADIALDKLTNKNALENRDVMDEMFGSLPADIISFLPFSAVAGYKQAKGNIGIRNAIRMAMTDPVRFESDMLNNVQTGKVSPEDAAQKMAYVKNLLKVYRGNDLNTEKLLSLTPEQRFEYANNLLEENGINHKIKGMTDDLQIAAEREKIAILQERRKTLLNEQQEPAGANATNTTGQSVQSPGSEAAESEVPAGEQQATESPESKAAKDLLTTDKPVFTDFDGTAFKDGKLTPIGEELKAKIARGEDVTVLTARKGTEENLNFISEQLGISKDKIKAGLSPEGKASHLTPDAVFIDNDAKNRQAADKVGIKAIDPNMQMVDATTPDEITVGEMVDRTGTYKGEMGRFFQDGQSVVFKVDGKNKEYELGNIEEVKNDPISSFGIVNEQSVVNVNDAGNVEVRGKEYVNHFSDPVAAINYDKDGNIQSVNLETADGKKRTFRGNIAEDIAYQIHLQKITKDNETTSRFEEYINTPDVAKTINERLPEVAQEGPAGDNGQVQPAERTKVEPLSAEELFEQKKADGSIGVFKEMSAEEGVKMVAQQAQGIDNNGKAFEGPDAAERTKMAYDATVSQFGEQLVKAAVKKYPADVSGNAVAPTIENFAERIAAGEKMTSPEDLQFYENNKGEIEKVLSAKAAQSTPAKPISDKVKNRFQKLKTKSNETNTVPEQAEAIKAIEDKAADAADTNDPTAAAEVIEEIDAILHQTPEQQARDAGEKTVDGNVYKRQEPLENVVMGKEVDILFTKDDKEPANYAVIEASELQPSHKSGIKNEMHFIPEAQPRDRGGMEVLKNEAKLKSDNLDPNQLADNNIAYFGAPIVNERGEVIQGNGRAEAVDYYYNNDVKDSRGYKDMILNKAEDLGLDRQKVEAMDKPVLVKMTKANDERAIELGNYTSSELEDVKQKNADVKAAFNRLTPAKVQELSSTINSKIDETTTLKQIIRDNSKVILDKLFDLGALRADNKERYINKEGQVTAEGVQASYDVVRQLLFEGGASDLQAKFDNLPFNVREAIEKTIPAILSNPELKARVQESIEIMREQQESGTADFASWKVQQEIFGDQLTPVEKYDKSVLDFAQGMMESKTQKGIAERIVKLSKEMNGTPADMFAEAVPEKRFEDAYDQEGIRFAIQEEAGSDLKQMKDIVRDIQNEYAEKDEQITLDDIKAIAKKELGSDYNEQLVEDAYNEAGKENRRYKKATAIKNEIAKRVEEFTGQEVTVMPNSESLIKKAKELGANKFQNENAVFETRDGKPVGFNYDTDQVARERFDIQKLEKIGAGSDRTVFDLGDGKVLKVAHTARGLEQNIHEGDYYLQGIVPTVHERGLNYVVADNIPRMKASDMVKTYDVETGNETGTARAADMIKELQTLSARDYEIHTDKAQNILGKYGLGDVLNYNILAGDFSAMRNWGYKDGVPYHIDGGTFGGIDMITSHRGKTPLSNPEFREIYNKSRQLKKQYGDSDKYTKFMRSPDGEVLGFTHDGKIYLNGERLNPNTIVHEAGHIWTEVAMTQMPAVYKRGIELVNGSNYMKRVVSNQFYQKEALKLPKAQRKAYFEHEALAQAIGDKGAQFVTEARRKSFLDWATELWNRVAKIAGFKNVTAKELQDMTLEEFAKRSAGEILKGSQKDMVAEPVEETTTEKKKPSAEGSVLLSHSGLQDIADDFGLSDVTSRDHKSDEKLAEEAATLSRQWHDEGTYAENIDRLINNIFSGRGSNDVEKTILQQHIANVRAEASKLDVYSKAYDEKLKELERLKNAGAALKSTAAATLRDTTVFSDADPTMADWMAERKTVLEVDELTNGQKKEIQDIWNEYETNLKTADEKVYKAEQLIDQLKAELAVKTERQKRAYIRSKGQESLKQERSKIINSIKAKLEKFKEPPAPGTPVQSAVPGAELTRKLIAIAPEVSKLVTNLIDSGIIKLADIVDNVHGTLVDAIPGITKRDVHNIIAGDYNEKRPTLTELEYLKKDIIEQAKLMNKLEKLQNGEPVGTEKHQRKRIKEITDLRNQIKEYRKYDQSSRTPEQILNAIKKRNEARQKQIEEKIANKDFSTQPKKPPLDENKLLKQANPELWKETMDAINAKEEVGHKFELLKKKDELAKRPPLKKYVVDPLGKVITTAKAIKAGIDDSVTMVQLMMAVYSNPKAGLKAKLEAFKDINNTRFKRQLAALHNSVYWDLIKKSELDITEPQSFGKKEVEELFSGNLLDDKFTIPFSGGKKVNPWTYTGGMFERIFTSMGNNLRLNLFYNRIAALEAQGKTFESHPEEYKGAARAINELTARGKMPKNIQASMDAISPIIWAPKMLASTFNTLGITDVAAAFRGKKGVYRSIPPQQARYLAWQMSKGIGLGVGVMAALAMRGWGVDKDPRSNTFGNVTSPDGNTKYNVFGRFSSLVKNIVQLGWGTRVESSGAVTDIDKTMGGRLQSLYKFARGKMTPAAGLFSDYWLNKKVNTFTKQPISLEPGSLAKDMLLPISLTDIKSSLEQDGTMALLTRFLPALEGIQVTDRRDYKMIASSLPDRAKKYLSDRNIAEPFFNPKQIEIKQMKKGVGEIKKLSDFDEETQKKYENTHSRIFDQELARLKSSFVFKDEYGNISLNSDNSKDKKIWVKDLDEKGLKKFIGIVNGKATAKTKEILFKEYKK